MSDIAKTSNQEAVVITEAALTEIKRLLALETEENLFLRLGVAAGGCSGMSYSMGFDNEPQETDRLFDYNGLPVRIEAAALPYLKGAQLDYSGGMLGGGFQFSNPNARRSCGCGTSFTV